MAYQIPKQTLLTVLSALKSAKGLFFTNREAPKLGATVLFENRHKGAFIFYRTERTGHLFPAWSTDKLTDNVGKQFDAVLQFLVAKLGTGGELATYSDPNDKDAWSSATPFQSSSFYHFNLENIAVTRLNGQASNLHKTYLSQRKNAVRTIVWRAAALHDDLWDLTGNDPKLLQAKLGEILDRRLRAVERMRLQINAGGKIMPRSAPGRGPWDDGARVRIFEYPYFPKVLTDVNDRWTVPPDPPVPGRFWKDVGQLCKYEVKGTGQDTRFDGEPLTPSPTWIPVSTDIYRRVPSSTALLSYALNALFKADTDNWKRAWLYCDHSIAATQLEALCFQMTRNAQNFDNAISSKQPYIGAILGSLVFDPATGVPHVVDQHTLWADGSVPDTEVGYFDNALVDSKALEVGDHVILWNHHMYHSVSQGPWGLENALITEIDISTDNWDELTDKAKKEKRTIDESVFMRPKRDKLRLDGFGAGHRYNDFLFDLFSNISSAFSALQSQSQHETGNYFLAPLSSSNGIVVRWSPYSGINSSPGINAPWFIFLPRVIPYATIDQMLDVIVQSIADDPSRQGGYIPPPSLPVNISDGVFFPLFLPVSRGRPLNWNTYLTIRAQNTSLQVTLRKMPIVPEMVPGLFVRGDDAPVELLRPRVRQ